MRQCIFFVLLLIDLPMLSQQNQAVHLCVAALEGAGGNVSGSVARDALIKSLNKQKPDKNSPVTIEADSLDTSSHDDSMAAAKQKSCDFLVTTNLLETHADSSYLGGLSQVNIQTFFVTVAYKLSKVSDGSEMSSASFKAQDKSSEQNAIGFTMNKIAGKVTGEIRKAAATK